LFVWRGWRAARAAGCGVFVETPHDAGLASTSDTMNARTGSAAAHGHGEAPLH
jgi:hypothetical protein